MIKDPLKTVTAREAEYIALFASGYDYSAIAAAKYVSYSTARRTLNNARENVGADSLAQLVALSLTAGLIKQNGTGFKPVVDPYSAE